MSAPSKAPVPKVVAGTVAGAVTVILAWVSSLVGLDVPAYVASAVTVVLTALAAYVTTD